MKLIHCSDIHLDAPISAELNVEQGNLIREESIRAFESMVAYGHKHQCKAILISGDLFDTPHPRKQTVNRVIDCISAYPDTAFVLLPGNHDSEYFNANEVTLHNLFILKNGKKKLTFSGNVVVYATEKEDFSDVKLDETNFNIVLYHGDLPTDRHKGIDYLAMGHYHTFRQVDFDRGTAVYSGCLYGRGFDECGSKGFVLLETGTKPTVSFVPLLGREWHRVEVPYCGNAVKAEKTALSLTRDIPKTDCVEVVVKDDIDTVLLENKLNFFHTKITKNFNPSTRDVSVLGEVKKILSEKSDLSFSDKQTLYTIIESALNGEEVQI